MRLRKKTFSESEPLSDEHFINLTPLIDVVFVVLISFIVIAPILQGEKVALAPAGETSEKLSSENKTTIYVLEDNTFSFHQKKLGFVELKQTLIQHKKKSDAIPCIYHDEKASFGTYQRLKNLLESLGYLEMDVVLSHER